MNILLGRLSKFNKRPLREGDSVSFSIENLPPERGPKSKGRQAFQSVCLWNFYHSSWGTKETLWKVELCPVSLPPPSLEEKNEQAEGLEFIFQYFLRGPFWERATAPKSNDKFFHFLQGELYKFEPQFSSLFNSRLPSSRSREGEGIPIPYVRRPWATPARLPSSIPPFIHPQHP
jgi:hypothetical protein